MKKMKLLLSLLALVVGIQTAGAQEVSDYQQSFDGLTVTNSNKTIIGLIGWSQYNGSSTAYATYTNPATGGVNDGAYLENTYNYEYATSANRGLLITPLVKGTVKMWAKSMSSSTWRTGSVKFFTFTKNANGNWIQGSQITPETYSVANGEDWSEIVLPELEDYTYVGILNYYCGIDEFSASYANIVKTAKLSIASVSYEETSPINMDENHKATVTVTATITNEGEIDFAPGDENFSLTVRRGSYADSPELATVEIDQALAVGESYTKTFTVEVNEENVTADGDTFNYIYLFENISNSYKSVGTIKFNAYAAKFGIAYGSTDYTTTNPYTLNFGASQESVSREFKIFNQGTAPLTLDIANTGDFSYTLTDNVVPAQSTISSGFVTLTITMDAVAPYGEKSGSLVISGNDMTDYTFNLSGTLRDPSKFYVDFEDGKIPNDMAEGDNWSFYSSYSGKYAHNTATNGVATKLISPKLLVAEGETLTFSTEQRNSSYSRFLNVLYSADRVNWTTALEIPQSSLTWSFTEYTVDNIPAGEWYIAFEGANVEIDDISGFTKVAMDYDLYALATSIPASGMVNSELTTSATFKNLKNALAAGDYTAELVIGTETYPTTAVDLASGAKNTFNINITPHTAGTFDAFVRISVGNETFESEHVELTVKEEVVTDVVVIGEQDSNWYSGSHFGAPLATTTSSNTFGATGSVYKAAELNLTAGSKINKITYYGGGYSYITYKSVKAYIGNTTDETANISTDGMTLIYDGSITTNYGGNGSSPEEKFSFVLDEPFTYSGDNLKLVFLVETDGSRSVYTTFQTGLGSTIAGNGASADDITTEEKTASPVLYLSVEKMPIEVTGVITGKEDNSPIAGVEVKAVSGNVEYTATTDNSGAYTLTIVKNDLTYDLTATANGYFPYAEEGIQFTQNVEKNIVLQEAKGLYIAASDIAAEGMVNNEYTATIDVQNVDPAAHSATVKLYVDGQAVATEEIASIASGETQQVSLTFTPHAAGEKAAYIEVTWEDGEAQTAEKTVNIKEEMANGVKQVGNATSTTTAAPAKLDFYNSYSFSYYTPDMIGLEAGTAITAITYKGYANITKTYDANMEVYLENTTETAGQAIPATKVYSGTQTIEKKGTATSPVDYLVFEFDEPFVYDGNNLKVVVKSSATTWVSGVTFQSQSGTSVSVRYNDNTDVIGNMSTTTSAIPVMYLSYDTSATISGQVTDTDEEIVEGATVTLTSGEVQYSGTTDAEGNYRVKVAQKQLSYTITVEAEGYSDYTEEGISFADGNVEKNVTLEKAESIDVALNSYGYATLYYSDKNFTVPAGINATTYTENGKVSKTYAEGDVIPADEAVVLQGEKNTTATLTVTTTTGAKDASNALRGFDEAATTTGGVKYYMLSAKNGKVGFFWGAQDGGAFTSGAHKAYLTVNSANAPEAFLFDDTNAINTVEAETIGDGKAYNLAGQRVGADYKGVVIVNGKKQVRK